MNMTFLESESGTNIETYQTEQGDYVIKIKFDKETIDFIKNSKVSDGQKISLNDTVMFTAINNLISFFLDRKTNFIKLAESITSLHGSIAKTFKMKIDEAVLQIIKEEDESANQQVN